jgi:putative transposase
MRKAYQTDLCDAEWSCLKTHLPGPKTTGRPKLHCTREIINAIFFYVVRGGCAWRLLPNDFPPWKTVYHYFRFWRSDGTWERMHSAPAQASAGAPEEGAPAQCWNRRQPVGEDYRGRRRRAWLRRGAKKVKGRKRHLLVDTQGLVLESAGPQCKGDGSGRHQALA